MLFELFVVSGRFSTNHVECNILHGVQARTQNATSRNDLPPAGEFVPRHTQDYQLQRQMPDATTYLHVEYWYWYWGIGTDIGTGMRREGGAHFSSFSSLVELT